MCEPTKLKFDLPVGTWGSTEVAVEYPWHRDLDSIILPLLETAHEAQAERQKESREIRASEVYRVSHTSEHRAGELQAGDFKQSLHSSEHHRTVPAANAAKVIMSNGTKRKKGKDKTLPSWPNEEVRVCLKGVDSTKWMNMMRGDYFQNLLEAFARECEPQKDVARLKMFWKGKWVKSLETPDDLGLEADAKFEVYELVQTRRGILESSATIARGHQGDPSKASIKTTRSTAEHDRPTTAPTENSVTNATLDEQRPTTASSAPDPNSIELSGMKATSNPTELQMPADVPSRESSKRTDQTGHSSNGSGSLAADYQAQCVAIHSLRHVSSSGGIRKLSLPSLLTTQHQDTGELQVPPAPAQRSRSPSPMRPVPTPIQVSRDSDPDPPVVMIEPLLEPDQQRRQSLHLAVPGEPVSRLAPFIPPLRTTKSKEDGISASVAGYKYQNAVLRNQIQGPSSLTPVVLKTTIESGGRRVSNTYRTSWP